ncbi:hypothetical protein MMKA1_08200 [Methanococcus maripaludis KA1]|jgi:hypothetical protein|uniref:Uncharacterized protein n=1 Tax=Methanococcus maripaludis KA1 TaxID=637914 RepID=A0A2Z5PQN8_METMI|nr:hypothetical protein [Methanococcus maripaludis]BAP60937.1 hypothetical protein MMKA1_08200 [Methanococcus maripaludis KA1]
MDLSKKISSLSKLQVFGLVTVFVAILTYFQNGMNFNIFFENLGNIGSVFVILLVWYQLDKIDEQKKSQILPKIMPLDTELYFTPWDCGGVGWASNWFDIESMIMESESFDPDNYSECEFTDMEACDAKIKFINIGTGSARNMRFSYELDISNLKAWLEYWITDSQKDKPHLREIATYDLKKIDNKYKLHFKKGKKEFDIPLNFTEEISYPAILPYKNENIYEITMPEWLKDLLVVIQRLDLPKMSEKPLKCKLNIKYLDIEGDPHIETCLLNFKTYYRIGGHTFIMGKISVSEKNE